MHSAAEVVRPAHGVVVSTEGVVRSAEGVVFSAQDEVHCVNRTPCLVQTFRHRTVASIPTPDFAVQKIQYNSLSHVLRSQRW